MSNPDAARGSGAAGGAVAAQYEAYPYPARDPRDEDKRLIQGSPSAWPEILHHLHGGRWPRERPFRALFAGGGTGDGAIMLAQQLSDAGVPGEVVHLDPSEAAQAIALARAERRGLTNTTFVRGSLLDVADLFDRPFDHIDCCGVLHHLADPSAGLAALNRVLSEDGGLGLMVYGALGRRGVYDVQAAAAALIDDAAAPRDRLALGKRLVKDLPATNWLRRNPFVADHKTGGDAGLYDLLLHTSDRAFDVGEVLDLLAGSALRLVTWLPALRYRAATYLADPVLRARASRLGAEASAALAERLAGNLTKHVFYAARTARAPADPHDGGLIPLAHRVPAATLAKAIDAQGRLPIKGDGLDLAVPLPRSARAVLSRIDGRRTIGEIAADLTSAQRDEVPAVLTALADANLVLLVDGWSGQSDAGRAGGG